MRRGRGRPIEEARQVILEAAAAILAEESYDLPSLERVAETAGVHKMTIFRAFGSREGLANACAVWLCDQELASWRQIVEQCQGASGCKIRALFDILAQQLLDGTQIGCRLHRLATHFDDSSQAIQLALDARRRELRTLFLQLAQEAAVEEPDVLAEALCLLWDGATVPLRSRSESREVALVLPSAVSRLIGSHLP